jgi:hypothetical protein
LAIFIRLKDIHGSNATLGNMVGIFRLNQSPYSSHNKPGIFFWTSLSRIIGIMSPESRGKEELGISGAEIARHLGVNTSSINRSLARMEESTK